MCFNFRMRFCLLFDNIESAGIVKFLRLFSHFVDLFYEVECLSDGDEAVGLEVAIAERVSPFEIVSEAERGYDILVDTCFIDPFFVRGDDEIGVKYIKEETGEARSGHLDIVVGRGDASLGGFYLDCDLGFESLVRSGTKVGVGKIVSHHFFGLFADYLAILEDISRLETEDSFLESTDNLSEIRIIFVYPVWIADIDIG